MSSFQPTAVLTLLAFTGPLALAGPLADSPEVTSAKSNILETLRDPAISGSKSGLGAKDGLSGKEPLLAPELSPPSWKWQLSLGPAFRHTKGIKYNGSTRSGNLSIPSFVGSNSLQTPDIGPGTLIGDRTYNNGFVNMDGATGVDGSTWFWGYDDTDTQVAGDNLIFNATGYESIRSDQRSLSSSLSDRDSQDSIIPHLQLHAESPHTLANGLRFGWDFSLNFSPHDQDVRYADFALLQTRDDYRIDWTDTYDLQGVIPPLANPSDPYVGTFDGPGPIIGNIPDSRTDEHILINTDTAYFENNISASFDGDLFTFGFGPTLTRERQDFQLRAGAGVSVNFLNWNARQRETLSLTETSGGSITGSSTYREWNDRDSGLLIMPGVYGQAELLWTRNNTWFASCFTRLDLTTSEDIQIGPSTFEIDHTGYTVGFQVGRSF